MEMHRDPTYPSARVLLGDYAIKQNQEDRSQPLLNEIMDTSFRGVHEEWKALWEAQGKAEASLNVARSNRYLAIQSLNQAIRDALHAVGRDGNSQVSSSNGWALHRCLDVLYQPAALELERLAEHIRRLEVAGDDFIPGPFRRILIERYQAALEMQRALEDAEEKAEEARRRRVALDNVWLEAFNAYHRAVEFIAFSNRPGPREWIQHWFQTVMPSDTDVSCASDQSPDR